MRLTVDLRLGRSRIRNHFWRIEHAEPKTRREQSFERDINVFFRETSLLHCIEKLYVVRVTGCFCEEVGALVVHPHLQGNGTSICHARGEVMTVVDIDDGVTIRNYISLELPSTAELILQKKFAGTRRLPVHTVVSAHDRGRFSFDDCRSECGEICVFHVVPGDINVHGVPLRFGPAMYRVVFRCRDHAVILRIVSLQPGHKRHAHAPGEKWILTVCLLSTPPARIAEDVDVRRPEIEALPDVATACAYCLLVLGASLDTNHHRHFVDRGNIECCGQADRLWKYRGDSGAGDAVQSFTPPVVLRNVEPWNRTRLVYELRSF